MARKRSHESERERSEASRKGHHKGHRKGHTKLTVIGPHLGGKHDRKRGHRKSTRRKRA